MTAPIPAPSRLRPVWWALWVASLALLTYGLLTPNLPEIGGGSLPDDTDFWVSKAVHVGSYAYLSLLVALLARTARGEAGLRLLLIAHGAATEGLQTFVEGRYGSLQDVGIDSAGVILGWGLACLARRWCRPAPPPG